MELGTIRGIWRLKMKNEFVRGDVIVPIGGYWRHVVVRVRPEEYDVVMFSSGYNPFGDWYVHINQLKRRAVHRDFVKIDEMEVPKWVAR